MLKSKTLRRKERLNQQIAIVQLLCPLTTQNKQMQRRRRMEVVQILYRRHFHPKQAEDGMIVWDTPYTSK